MDLTARQGNVQLILVFYVAHCLVVQHILCIEPASPLLK